MISLKVLSATAVMALVLPMAAPSASLAQTPPGFHSAANPQFGVPRGSAPSGGGGGAGFNGGGSGGFRGGGGGAPVAQFGGGGGWRGGGDGGYRGGYGGGYRHHDRDGGGFIPGAVAGAVIGGALASQSYGYYDSPGYYAPGYYDDQYYDGGFVAVAPAPVGGGDAVAYCMQTYRSYDPASGTYLGYDGLRHPCP
jgi:hypothetical protein